MKIPEKVRVCGLNYDVKMSDTLYLDEGCYGTHNPSSMVITIQNHTVDKDRQMQVFIHELIHAVDLHYLNSKLTEDQVNQVANGVYQILADNNCFCNQKGK
jgi:hypothetical protein